MRNCFFSVLPTQSSLQYYKTIHPRDYQEFKNLIFLGTNHIYAGIKPLGLRKILDARADQLIVHTLAICAALAIALVGYIIYPLYLCVSEGIKPMPLPIVLPFFNPSTNAGYYLSLLLQVTACGAGITGNYGFEICYSIILNNLWAASDVVQYELNELSLGANTCRLNRGATKEPVAGVGGADGGNGRRIQFRRVLIQLQDIDR